VFELVLIDVGDDQREGRSSSAKKADALFKIAFARRSSRTSRSSSASRVASSVVVPARWPSSISAWMTQLRNVSALMPNCSAIRFNAPVRVAGSRRASTAILVARSRSSSGYFLGAAMTLILTWIESLHQTRGETLRGAQHRDEAQATVRRITGELAELAERAARDAERLLTNARRALHRARTKAADMAAVGGANATAGRRRGRLRRAIDDLTELLTATHKIAAQTRPKS
jgi:hypothetical protein